MISLAMTVVFLLMCVFVSRRCTSLQHLPYPECDPALHGGAVHRRQRVLQVTPQHHPQLRHPLRLRRYGGKERGRKARKGEGRGGGKKEQEIGLSKMEKDDVR